MFIKVMLERIFEVDYELEELGIESIDEITDMERLEMVDDHSKNVTTELKTICIMTEDEIKAHEDLE